MVFHNSRGVLPPQLAVFRNAPAGPSSSRKTWMSFCVSYLILWHLGSPRLPVVVCLYQLWSGDGLLFFSSMAKSTWWSVTRGPLCVYAAVRTSDRCRRYPSQILFEDERGITRAYVDPEKRKSPRAYRTE